MRQYAMEALVNFFEKHALLVQPSEEAGDPLY